MLLAAIIIVALIVFFAGPRAKVALFWNPKTSRVRTEKHLADLTSADLKALRDKIIQHESAVNGVIDGAEKIITFSSETRPKRTKYCVLYIHGFSACRQEISPIPESIASSLHANIYATRLNGHGQDSDALAKAKPGDWLFDAAEAWDVAQQLGEQVIIIATSTGATLATWMAQQSSVIPNLAALILVSPNYKMSHWAMPMFLWPWAKVWLPLISSEEHSWEPTNEGGEKYWTYRYPTTCVYGLNALVTAVSKSSVEHIEAPTLFIYSDGDKIVNSAKTDEISRKWGSAIKHRILVPAKKDDNNHVVSGDIVRPENTEQSIADIRNFIKNHIPK